MMWKRKMIVIKLSSAGIQKILKKKGLFLESDTKPRILMNMRKKHKKL